MRFTGFSHNYGGVKVSRKRDIETCFNYCSKLEAFFSSNERRWITRIHRLAKKYPEKVRIIKEPEENDGTVYVSLPVSFLRIQGPAVRKTQPDSDDNHVEFEDVKDIV